MTNYTVDEVAEKLKVAPRTVRYAANALGMKKFGRDWVFTDEDIARLQARKTTPGPVRSKSAHGQADIPQPDGALLQPPVPLAIAQTHAHRVQIHPHPEP